jgi:hypothetical protein
VNSVLNIGVSLDSIRLNLWARRWENAPDGEGEAF